MDSAPGALSDNTDKEAQGPRIHKDSGPFFFIPINLHQTTTEKQFNKLEKREGKGENDDSSLQRTIGTRMV